MHIEFHKVMDKIYKKDLVCFSCKRDLPNISHKTKNGCKYCDVELYKGEEND